jgi:hypothetical protein
MTHDYKRNGTTNLFAALNTLDGAVVGRCMLRHSHMELILSANSCGVSQCCEPRHARLGSWYAIKPSHHAGHIDCSRRADFL